MIGASDIGIDLGTAVVLVFVRGRGVVVNEPAVVAVDKKSGKPLGVGNEARTVVHRIPEKAVLINPLENGNIINFEATEEMINYYIRRSRRKLSMWRPRIVVSIPVGLSSVEKRALFQFLTKSRAGEAYLVEQPRSAAIGAGLDIFKPSGNMIVDIGGGVTDVAVLSLNQMVVSGSVKAGGCGFDQAIMKFLKNEKGILIDQQSAEMIKISIGAAVENGREQKMEVKGVDGDSITHSIRVSSREVAQAVAPSIDLIVEQLKKVLGRTPPELASDIMDSGITLTGGGALLRGINQYIAAALELKCNVAFKPAYCNVRGTSIILNGMDVFEESLITDTSTAAS